MAEPVQLDKAAALVGKSEVTLRRLVKAGKIPFEKEKTLTGFIYRVDPEKVREFYRGREGYVADLISNEETVDPAPAPEAAPAASSSHAQPVRIAVAGESGQAQEYWQKKSDLYEERFNQEVSKHAQTREELGVWRGRAEQAQSMLMKLLPAPQEVEVRQQPAAGSSAPAAAKTESNSSVVTVIISVLCALVVVAAAGAVYARFFMK